MEGPAVLFVALLFLFPSPYSPVPAATAQQTQPSNPSPTSPPKESPSPGPSKSANGKAVIGNNGSITAGDKTATVTLARGGTLQLCSTTTVHLSRDRSIADAQSSALMISLDRGALEASYATGKYSDVLMTPDFRILISGPGQTDLKIRVSPKGDTCLDNHGTDAPYITVTSLLEGGLYRVQPNQRVLFEHGSLNDVVDNETEPCGCPPAVLEAAKPVGGPSSTPADTAFPLAQSEGLAAPPPPPTTPAVPAGQPTPRSPSLWSTRATPRHPRHRQI